MSGGGPVSINTGTGSTTVLVDQTSGTLTLDGTGGSNNSVTFDATSVTQTMAAALLNGSGGGVALTGFGPIQTVDFAGFEQANLNLGSDINSLTIDETIPNLSVNTDQRVQTGSGNQVGADDSNNAGDNTITIEQIGTSSLPGAVDQINGGIGQNTVDVDLQTNPYNSSTGSIDSSLAFLKQLDLSRISSLIVNDSGNSPRRLGSRATGHFWSAPDRVCRLSPQAERARFRSWAARAAPTHWQFKISLARRTPRLTETTSSWSQARACSSRKASIPTTTSASSIRS